MKLMILDGNSLAYRAFFALPTDMVTAAGQVTNSVYGFTTMLLSVIKDHTPDGVVVVFDRKEPTFRHKAAPEYKAQREKQPDILYQQLDIIRELLDALGIVSIDAAGFEGDDLIATVAARASKENIDVLVVTGDRDTFQLVHDPHVRVMYNMRGVSDYALYDEAGIMARTGVTPRQYADYAALRGDPSDNLDGVPGVGEKTAAKLIAKYGNIAAVFDMAAQQTPKLRAALELSRDRVIRNAALMVLRQDAPVTIDIRKCAPKPDFVATKALFEKLEFRTMANRLRDAMKHLALDAPTESALMAVAIEATTVIAPVVRMISTASEAVSALSALSPMYVAAAWEGAQGRSPLLGLAVVTDTEASVVAWIPVDIVLDTNVSAALVASGPIRGHNLKPLLRSLLGHGIDVTALDFDTAIAAYLLDPSEGQYEIGDVLQRYTGLSLTVSGAQASGQLNFDEAPLSDVAESSAGQALAVFYLSDILRKSLALQGVENLYQETELPLVRVLARMEHIGVGVDAAQLREINVYLTREVERLALEIHKVAGKTFNINSPKQLSEVLYKDKLLKPPKKTKTGFSTDAATLEKLREQWPELIDPLTQYRELEKLRSTYGEGLLQVVSPDGRIHATFNQTVARTGRLSSDQPNLHNIPVRSEEGKVFRKAFVPSKGQLLLVADYNQIELRCIAHLAKDPGLTNAFNKGIDIHTATAASVFGVSPSDVTSKQRSQAKMVSYGLAYGMEAYGLSQRLAIAVDEASEILKAYFTAFPNVQKYMDATVEEARKRGYTETMFGRRRPIPELQNANFRIRQAGERQAMNAGIQGLAADIFKIALVRIDAELVSAGLTSRVILQVHDEVVVEAALSEKVVVEKLVLDAMKSAAVLSVPLEVNAAWGDSWASAKS